MSKEPSKFEQAASSPQPRGGFIREFWDFLKSNKKWWLLPIVVLMLIFGVLILLTSTGAAPFIYSLF